MSLIQSKNETSEDEFIHSVIDKSTFSETDSSTITILGRKVDKISFYIFLGSIIVIILLYYFSGVFKLAQNHKYLYVLMIASVLFFVNQIFTSSTTTAGTAIERDELISLSELIIVLFSSLVLFFVFNKNTRNNKILVIAIIILAINLIFISGQKSGTHYRTIRKVKQSLFNMALFMFIVFISLYFTTD